eukprot:1140406-Pelagomonas_calceolata.AAC.14
MKYDTSSPPSSSATSAHASATRLICILRHALLTLLYVDICSVASRFTLQRVVAAVVNLHLSPTA